MKSYYEKELTSLKRRSRIERELVLGVFLNSSRRSLSLIFDSVDDNDVNDDDVLISFSLRICKHHIAVEIDSLGLLLLLIEEGNEEVDEEESFFHSGTSA
jgi:hypothetical protein